jgi:hypothetical protein
MRSAARAMAAGSGPGRLIVVHEPRSGMSARSISVCWMSNGICTTTGPGRPLIAVLYALRTVSRAVSGRFTMTTFLVITLRLWIHSSGP